MELAAAQKREQIRSMIKTKRRHLSCDDWELCSQAICEKIIKLPFYKEADIIILVYDITKNDSFKEIQNYWLEQVKENTLDLKGNYF
jgi:5-formyltetrahydrofolate cyclo-ligase